MLNSYLQIELAARLFTSALKMDSGDIDSASHAISFADASSSSSLTNTHNCATLHLNASVKNSSTSRSQSLLFSFVVDIKILSAHISITAHFSSPSVTLTDTMTFFPPFPLLMHGGTGCSSSSDVVPVVSIFLFFRPVELFPLFLSKLLSAPSNTYSVPFSSLHS